MGKAMETSWTTQNNEAAEMKVFGREWHWSARSITLVDEDNDDVEYLLLSTTTIILVSR